MIFFRLLFKLNICVLPTLTLKSWPHCDPIRRWEIWISAFMKQALESSLAPSNHVKIHQADTLSRNWALTRQGSSWGFRTVINRFCCSEVPQSMLFYYSSTNWLRQSANKFWISPDWHQNICFESLFFQTLSTIPPSPRPPKKSWEYVFV